MTASPIPVPHHVDVATGPALLSGQAAGPGLAAHRAQYGELPGLDLAGLQALVEDSSVVGRGGAAFPFATKLRAATGRRPVVVVNLSEGEPASAKDHALALARPHLVLDGAVATARALRARDVHVVLPGDRPAAAESVRRAVAERTERFTLHTADSRFVAGQARAVLELMAGRPNLPVTAWAPEAISGHRGRPTLLSNAETWAQVGRLVLVGTEEYAAHGQPGEPGTTLLTFASTRGAPHVAEAAYGSRLRDVLPPAAHGRPALVGGFHGQWATWSTLASARVSVTGLRALGVPLGAGVVLTPGAHECPVDLTARITSYLAAQSAGRCGPCKFGLPTLAGALDAVAEGRSGPGDEGVRRVEELAGLVTKRGACAHPDGTARLVRSLLATFPLEVAAHGRGDCEHAALEVAS